MISRLALVAALVCLCGPALAVVHTRPAPAVAAKAPITFTIVKGAPDACGHGCDRWIAVDGQIDADAAARFRKFLSRQRDRSLPFYFNSPGGNLDQAVAMGNMLHDKPAMARVARSVVTECGFEAQDSEVCVKLKQSGRELHGELFTRGALCASACPYILAGAAVHEVAPDAVLGVHSAKVVLNLRGIQVDPAVVAVASQRGHERADQMVAAYLAKMRIDPGLLNLARTVKFEDLHVLTREEIARFGLDRRELVETPWKFESSELSILHKIIIVRGLGESSFRLLQWRVACFDANRFALQLQRPASANASIASVSIMGVDAKPVYFIYPPARPPGFELWSLRMPRTAIQSLLDRPQIEFTETSTAADGRRVPQTIKLSNEGWAHALESLLATCPPAKDPAAAQISRSGEAVAK
jgi:hypothetical protein